MAFEVLVAEEFWRRLAKIGDRGVGERLAKAIRRLKDSPRERGRMLAGVEHPVHGRIHRLRVGKFRVLYCVDQRAGKVYVLTFELRDHVYDL